MKNWALRWPTCERHTDVRNIGDVLPNAVFSSPNEARRFFLPFSFFLSFFLSFSFISLQTASRVGIMKSARFATPCRISKKLERKNGETTSLNNRPRCRNVKRRRDFRLRKRPMKYERNDPRLPSTHLTDKDIIRLCLKLVGMLRVISLNRLN